MTPASSIAASESTPSREALASVAGSQPMLTILRVYNNGDRLPQRFPREQALDEIEYSIKWRFGCALFIGSECVQYGYLGPDRCAAISAELSSANTEGQATAKPLPAPDGSASSEIPTNDQK